MADLDDIREQLKTAPDSEYTPGQAVSDVAAKRTMAELASRLDLNPTFVTELFEELAEASGKRLEGAVSVLFDAAAPFLSGGATKAPQVNYWAVRLPGTTLSVARLQTIAWSSCGWPKDATKIINPSKHTEGAYLLSSPTRTAAILNPDNDDDVWMIPMFDSVVSVAGDSVSDYKWQADGDTFELSIFGKEDDPDRKLIVTIPMGALSLAQQSEIDQAIKGNIELTSIPWLSLGPGDLKPKPHTKVAWEWMDSAHRDNTVATVADVGRVGVVLDDGSYWRCASTVQGDWDLVENPDNGCASCWNSHSDEPAACGLCGRDIPR